MAASSVPEAGLNSGATPFQATAVRARRLRPLPGDLAGHGVRDREDPRRLPDGAVEEGQQAEAHAPGQGLGMVQDREVVDRDHAGHRQARRQGQERRPEEVDVALRQPARQVVLLPDHAERRAVDLDRQAAPGEPHRLVQGGVRRARRARTPRRVQKLAEERLGVDADAGGTRDQRAEIDADPRTVLICRMRAARACSFWKGRWGLSSRSGPSAAVAALDVEVYDSRRSSAVGGADRRDEC